VGLLDVDICGPSIPTMTGVSGHEVHNSGSGWSPVYPTPNLAVMSVGFILPERDSAVIWRGPRKNGMIKQFLTETDWGGHGEGLDYLIVDTPPGTSDEHISTVQFLQGLEGGISGALVVTTPEEISMADVRKELNFCKKTNVPVLGVVENMAAIRIPVSSLTFFKRGDSDGGEEDGGVVNVTSDVFDKLGRHCPEILDMMAVAEVFAPSFGGPKVMAENFGVPYLGAIPLDPNLLKCCEEGLSFVECFGNSPAVKPLNKVCDEVLKVLPLD